LARVENILARLLRFLFDHFQSDTLFNLLLSTKPMRLAAGIVYFHRKGVFNPTVQTGANQSTKTIVETTTRR